METRNFLELVKNDIELRRLLPPGAKVLAAVSGGADSVALILMLVELVPEFGWKLQAAHFNHGMRAESEADEGFVRALCEHFNVPFSIRRSSRLTCNSSEERARDERLRFLRETADQVGCLFICTGHTADDRAETVLLNLIRGSGLAGLRGIRWSAPPFVRPFLGRTRTEIVRYLASHDQKWREDISNTEVRYTRNRMRHQVLPLLEREFNPAVRLALARLAESVAEDDDYLEALAADLLQSALASGDDVRLVLRSSALAKAPVAVARRVVRHSIQRLRGSLRDIDLAMIDRVISAALTDKPRFSLGRGLSVESSTGYVTLSLPEPKPEEFDIPLQELGTVDIPGGRYVIHVTLSSVPPPPDTLGIVINKPAGLLHARNWCPGDRMRPEGLGGSKKLQDIFTDSKVPSSVRHRVPVVCIGDDIAWVPGIAKAEGIEQPNGELSIVVEERSRLCYNTTSNRFGSQE